MIVQVPLERRHAFGDGWQRVACFTPPGHPIFLGAALAAPTTADNHRVEVQLRNAFTGEVVATGGFSMLVTYTEQVNLYVRSVNARGTIDFVSLYYDTSPPPEWSNGTAFNGWMKHGSTWVKT